MKRIIITESQYNNLLLSEQADSKCYNTGYLRGLIKGINTFTGISNMFSKNNFITNSGISDTGKKIWKETDCYICYKHKNSSSDYIKTNICFNNDRSYFVETFSIHPKINFKINDGLSKAFNLGDDFNTNYVSYIGYWSTIDKGFNKDVQVIVPDIKYLSLAAYKDDEGNLKKGSGFITVNRGFNTIINNYFLDYESLGSDTSLPLKSENEKIYDDIDNLLGGFYVSLDEIVESLIIINNNFNNYQEFNDFNKLVELSDNESVIEMIDDVSIFDSEYVDLKQSLFDILNKGEDWTKLTALIEKIKKL